MSILSLNQNQRESVFVRKSFRRFFVPSLLSCLGIAVGGLADCVFVGNVIGPVGLTAISIGQPVYMVFNTISYALSIGGSIHYATAMAEGRREDGIRIFNNVLRAALAIYITLCALGLAFLPQVLTFLGAGTPGTELWDNCEALVRAQLLLVPIMFSQGPFLYFINSDNNPKLGSFAFVVSNTLDVVFNYVFVVVMDLGVAGSVYSTGVGASVMVLISMTHFIQKKGSLRFSWPRFDGKVLLQSFKTGFATAVQYIYQFITILVCNRLLMEMSGELGVAVFNIVFNVALLAATVYDALSMALQPMVSTFRGEHNRANIRATLRLSIEVGMVVSAVLMGVLLIVPGWVSFAFGLRTQEELLMGVSAIRIYAVCLLPAGVNMVMNYYYQAMEEEFASYLLFTLRSFVFYLAFSLLLGRLGAQWFWWLYPCTEAATLAALLLYGKKRGSLTLLDNKDDKVFSALLYSKTANLGQVEQDVAAYMESLEASPTQAYYASIVVEEVCGAIMNNAFFFGEGYIQFTIVPHEDKTVTIHVRDDAKRFNPFDLDTDSIDLDRDAGLDAIGIKMIKSKAKEFFYRRYAGFNTLVVRV